MATTEPLTEREQQALEQMRQAQERGSTERRTRLRLAQPIVRHRHGGTTPKALVR